MCVNWNSIGRSVCVCVCVLPLPSLFYLPFRLTVLNLLALCHLSFLSSFATMYLTLRLNSSFLRSPLSSLSSSNPFRVPWLMLSPLFSLPWFLFFSSSFHLPSFMFYYFFYFLTSVFIGIFTLFYFLLYFLFFSTVQRDGKRTWI